MVNLKFWNEQLWLQKREQWLADEASGKDELPDEMKDFSL